MKPKFIAAVLIIAAFGWYFQTHFSRTQSDGLSDGPTQTQGSSENSIPAQAAQVAQVAQVSESKTGLPTQSQPHVAAPNVEPIQPAGLPALAADAAESSPKTVTDIE